VYRQGEWKVRGKQDGGSGRAREESVVETRHEIARWQAPAANSSRKAQVVSAVCHKRYMPGSASTS